MSLANVWHNGMYQNGPDIILLPRHARREGHPYHALFCCGTSNVNSFFLRNHNLPNLFVSYNQKEQSKSQIINANNKCEYPKSQGVYKVIEQYLAFIDLWRNMYC